MGVYADYLLSRLPAAVQGPWGRKWASTVGGLVDVLVSGTKLAAKSRFVADCPDDALAYHARDRMIDTVDGENWTQLRTRLLATWSTWVAMSSTQGLMVYMRDVLTLSNLYLYDMVFPFNSTWMNGAVGYPTDDANTDNWSRHVIVVGDPHPWARMAVGTGLVVGPGLLVGIDMTPSELARIRRVYRQKRGAHMVGIDIYVQFDATAPASIRAQHNISTDYVKLPLHRALVGYPHHGMYVGTFLTVGQVFT